MKIINCTVGCDNYVIIDHPLEICDDCFQVMVACGHLFGFQFCVNFMNTLKLYFL